MVIMGHYLKWIGHYICPQKVGNEEYVFQNSSF